MNYSAQFLNYGNRYSIFILKERNLLFNRTISTALFLSILCFTNVSGKTKICSMVIPGCPNNESLMATIVGKLDHTKNEKITAIALTITLGVFGVHRLYLGTEAHVPVIYTATFGGGFGIITLADLICILTTKDLSKYKNNDRVIMWLSNRKE